MLHGKNITIITSDGGYRMENMELSNLRSWGIDAGFQIGSGKIIPVRIKGTGKDCDVPGGYLFKIEE